MLYQEAEMALRIHDQPKLDNCFTNTSVESFAHSLLSRVFVETGRPDEAADEGKLALKQNVFSWTSLKTLCNLGVGNPENIYTSLLTCVNEARSTDKPKTSRSTSIATRNTEKLAKNAEKRTPSGSKEAEQKVTCFAPKKSKTPESLDFSVVFSRSSSSISVTSSCSPQPCRHRSREKFRLETCTRIMKRLQNFVSKPPSIQRLQYCIADWSTLFTTVIEYISWLAMLQCAVATYRSNSVIGRYNLMPEKCKKFALARELLARAYLEKLDYTKAAEILEELHREFPHRVAGMEILSTALWHAQDVRRLSVLAMQITEECRSCPEGWCVAGNCFSVQKQHDTAIECFERAVTINTRFPYAYTLLGHELLDSDHQSKAAAARALLLCPTDYRAWFGLGLLHFKKEQVNLARVHLSRAVAINPFNSVLLCQLSVVEQALHNNDTVK
ncbi:unnamed protein product [Onchocerca flexuosa]|uniref:Cell division cycle protein 27 homolog n=1 Tax=Onchocerca flexuosa TaxID=387005 RepID=A0A183I417_9BILA|nr:unnamed protein product [Onchocerca flexuosa]